MKIIKFLSVILIIILITTISFIIFSNQKEINPHIKVTNTTLESSYKYAIANRYALPKILNEVSGIAWLNDSTFACVQDEDGFIFKYNTNQNAIINEIPFASSGDYEGLTINQDDAYVLRSDGLIFEILNYNSESRKISKIKTPFTELNNMESLTFDADHNRLLIAPKDKDLGVTRFKSIYEIPIQTKTMADRPLIEIDLKSKELKNLQHKKIEKTLRPSAIAIHPLTQNIYVLDAKNPKLLIVNTKGEILKVYPLNAQEFAQPEGITFSANGRLFIANEANDYSANILEVELK